MGVANRLCRRVVWCAVLIVLFSSLARIAAGAGAHEQRFSQSVQPARDFFVGRWVRYGGDTFFPDQIVFEADPTSGDSLLVTFTLGCQRPAPACAATKARSMAVFLTGNPQNIPMVHVPWFTDGAGSVYDASFQMMPQGYRLVKGASKEINALFTMTPSFNRQALFAGTLPNELRYSVLPAAAPAPQFPTQRRPRVVPK